MYGFRSGITNKFVCLDRQYNFSFSDRGLEVTIDRLKRDSFQSIAEPRQTVETKVTSSDNGKNNDIYINNTKTDTEVAGNIIDLIPTMKEGLEYILQNSNEGNLEAGMRVTKDFAYCINSIDDAIKAINKTLPQISWNIKLKAWQKQ